MRFELPHLQHMNAQSFSEAVSWLHQLGPRGKVMAGGTDLLGLMKDRVEGPKLPLPEVLVNIKTIPEANSITFKEKSGLRLGPAVRLNDLAKQEVVGREFSLLCQAAGKVGTTQLRHMATIGGNLCQRPRCLYFRQPFFLCYKKGGSRCFAKAGEHRDHHGIFKNGQCVMAHPSDMAPALVALRAKIRIAGSGGEAEHDLREFFIGPDARNETILQPDSLIKELKIPAPKGKNFQCFLKRRVRNAADFALASVAVVAEMADQICQEIRIVLGGVAPFPYVAQAAEETLRGRRLRERIITEAAKACMVEARPLPANAYKVDLTENLICQALLSILHGVRGESGASG